MISVVIPTFNRAALLRASLKSLADQSMSPKEFEVVVVDDGSSDNTAEICESLKSLLDLKYFRIENSGIAAAKNLGIFASSGSIIIFFDDDDIAHPRFLEEHLRVHDQHREEKLAVLGYTEWKPGLKVSELMRFVTEDGCFLFSYPALADGQELDFTYFWGGRSSCKRSLLIKHGVFNQEFRFGSEDIELGYRLSRFGLKVLFNRNAIQYMNRALTFDEFCRRCERQGISQRIFSRLHQDPAIQKYCQVIGAEERWRQIEPVLPQAVRRVREIEAELAESRNGKHDGLLRDLKELYRWTFNAFKTKGIADATLSG